MGGYGYPDYGSGSGFECSNGAFLPYASWECDGMCDCPAYGGGDEDEAHCRDYNSTAMYGCKDYQDYSASGYDYGSPSGYGYPDYGSGYGFECSNGAFLPYDS